MGENTMVVIAQGLEVGDYIVCGTVGLFLFKHVINRWFTFYT